MIHFATSVLISLIALSSRYDVASVLCRYLQSVCPVILPYKDVLSESVDWLSRYFMKYEQRGDGHYGQTTFGIIYYTPETGRVVEIFKTLQISESSLKSFQFLV